MPDGGTVTISTRNVRHGPAMPPGLAEQDHVLIAVADTGSGMSEAVRHRAFEPFFTTKEPGSGTGLGLSMVYGFAQQLGGAATIDSAPDQGTTISLYLPRTDLPPNRDHASASKAFGDEQLDVLLVDDNAGYAPRRAKCWPSSATR